MMLDVIRLEDKVQQLGGNKKAGGKESARLAQAGDIGEIGHLKEDLKNKDDQINALKRRLESEQINNETLKKQTQGLTSEYHKLGDQVTGKPQEARKDQ